MPLYEYRCEKCGKTFEKFRRMSEADQKTECPFCSSQDAERQLSTFATGGSGNGGGCAAPAGGGARSRFR
jgi:putative FmdB family regulatory protein